MKKTIARLTTNVLNPFVASFIVIGLLAFKGIDTTAAAIKWASIATALSVLPVLVVVVYLVRRKKLNGFFENPRQQRMVVYLLASVLGAIGYGLLWYLKAPELLVATFSAGFASIVIFMWINLYWKISLHTAFMAGAVAILIIVYGAVATWTVLLLPPVAWARMELKQHSIMQVVAGTMITAALVVGIFWGYGLVG